MLSFSFLQRVDIPITRHSARRVGLVDDVAPRNARDKGPGLFLNNPYNGNPQLESMLQIWIEPGESVRMETGFLPTDPWYVIPEPNHAKLGRLA